MNRFEAFDHMFQKAGLTLDHKADTDSGVLCVWDGYCKHPHVTFSKFNGPEEQAFVTAWALVRNGEDDIHSFAGVQFHGFAEGLLKGKETRVREVLDKADVDIDDMKKVNHA